MNVIPQHIDTPSKSTASTNKEIRARKNLKDNRECGVAVAVGSDTKGEIGLFTLMNSVISNYSDESRVLCIFSFSSEKDFEAHTDDLKCVFDDLPHNVRIIPSLIVKEGWEPRVFANTMNTRAELNSDYNWFRWYLKPEHLQGMTKFVWLDTDTLVSGNIAELYDWDLKGKVAAAGSYKEPIRKHLCPNNPLLKEIQMTYHGETMNPLELPVHMNAGILVLDLNEFAKQNVLEEWNRLLLLHEERCLWTLANQPPFTLAIRMNYEELPEVWNIGGLGWNSGFRKDACEVGKILHWNGDWKPWNSEKAGCRGTWHEYDISKSKSKCYSHLSES